MAKPQAAPEPDTPRETPTTTTHALRHQPARAHDLRPGRVYLCVGPQCWGKGFTPEDAEKAARVNYRPGIGQRTPMPFIMFDAPPDVTVDEMGYTVYTPALYAKMEPATGEETAIEVSARADRNDKMIGDRPREIYRFKLADKADRADRKTLEPRTPPGPSTGGL